MEQNKKITCIIPAYNEEKRVSRVLNVVIGHPLIGEVIVVNDRSNDKTLSVIRKFKKIRVINNKKNLGKTLSVVRGLKASKNNIVLLLDADLTNLTKKNISDLILPVLNDKVDVTIALLGSLNIMRAIGADSGSGQRVFNKNMLPLSKLARLERYGLESFMNEEIIKNNYRIRIIDWKNAGCATKGEKAKSIFPFWPYVSMWIQMIKTSGFSGFILHSFQLARLNSKNKN